MGCGSSRSTTTRSSTARSWMAINGFAENEPAKAAQKPERTGDGKIRTQDSVTEVDRPSEAPAKEAEVTRDLGDGQLGISDSESIWQKLDKLGPNELFVDEDFKPDADALYFGDMNDKDKDVQWSRPKDITRAPYLLQDGISKDDIMQGILGDCWFLSSVAAVSQKPELMTKIVPENQKLYGEEYKGIVHFRLWRFGQWIDIYVDDLLPTKDNRLIYARCFDENEYWVALVEKAYAKLHGSYESIEGGQAMDALVDLTGGLAERYELVDPNQELYQKLARAAASGAFITCSKKGDWRSQSQEPDEFGLIAGHAYTITDVKRIKRKKGSDALVRVRNPWGTGQEWTGAWCDNDARWNLVDQETKDWLNVVEKDDGEFWMSFKDFCRHFQEVTICTLSPDFDGDGQADQYGSMVVLHNQWTENSAGGCRNDIQSFAKNPQYQLTVREPDSYDSSQLGRGSKAPETCCVLIGLMQEHRRSQRYLGVKMLQIGYIIYEAETPNKRLNVEHFMYNYETAKSGTYVNFREVVARFELPPGKYIVIPSTYNKGECGSFLLRAYSPKKIELIELAEYDALIATPAPPESPFQDELEQDVIPPRVSGADPNNFTYDEEDPEIQDAMRDENPSR